MIPLFRSARFLFKHSVSPRFLVAKKNIPKNGIKNINIIKFGTINFTHELSTVATDATTTGEMNAGVSIINNINRNGDTVQAAIVNESKTNKNKDDIDVDEHDSKKNEITKKKLSQLYEKKAENKDIYAKNHKYYLNNYVDNINLELFKGSYHYIINAITITLNKILSNVNIST